MPASLIGLRRRRGRSSSALHALQKRNWCSTSLTYIEVAMASNGSHPPPPPSGTAGSGGTKKPFICTLVRRMLGIKMATCSQDSRTLYVSIKSKLETALAPLLPMVTTPVREEAAEIPVCPLCRCLMMRPVCLPCSHSLCKPCLARSTSRFFEDSARCPRCHQSWPVVPPGMTEERKPTLLLQNVFMRWYPGWAECCKYREEGNRFAQEGDFPMAVHYYNNALETGILYGICSYYIFTVVYFCLQGSSLALVYIIMWNSGCKNYYVTVHLKMHDIGKLLWICHGVIMERVYIQDKGH